jgi:WD40 repeat protein
MSLIVTNCDTSVRGNRYGTASGDKRVTVRDAERRCKVVALKEHRNGVKCVAMNSTFLVTGSVNKTVRLYNCLYGERHLPY